MSAGVAGLVLAAGGGRRMGLPKALLAGPDGRPASAVAAGALAAAGCAPVRVVLGARADEAAALLAGDPAGVAVEVTLAEDWQDGMGRSLAHGLAALDGAPAGVVAALVTLVDLPDVGVPVMRRVLDTWRAEGAAADALVRASYGGRPGHPVLLGRDHWGALADGLGGDVGARTYLAGRTVREVSCDDLASGRDVDRPEDLGR